MLLHDDVVIGEHGEDDIEHQLEMSLVVGVVAIRYRLKEVGQHAEGIVHLAQPYQDGDPGNSGVALNRVPAKVMGKQTTKQPHPYLLVGKCQLVELAHLVVALYGDVATLVEQGDNRGHRLRGGIKILLVGIHRLAKVGGQELIFSHHVYEVSGRTRTEPVSVRPAVGKAVEQAERVVHVRRRPAEMVTIVVFPQLGDSLLPAQLQFHGQFVYVIAHLRQELLIGDATHASVWLIHAHVLDVVQLAENAQLRELGDACQEHEAQHWLTILQRRVEVAHDVAEHVKALAFMHNIKQRRVILVDEHHSLLACLDRDGLNQVEKPDVGILRIARHAETFFVVLKYVKQVTFKLRFLHVLAPSQAEVQHGILRPLLLQLLDGKPLEEVFPTLEIALESGHQQRLAEPPGAAQEEVRAIGMRHLVDVSRLVDIELILLTDTFKRLYSYWV